MSYEGNIEDVEQFETNEVRFEGYGIRDADTAEGQARRAEEAHFEEVSRETDKGPLGGLDRVPSEGQFQFCELVDTDSGDLIGFITEGDTPKGATDQEVREAIEAVEGGI